MWLIPKVTPRSKVPHCLVIHPQEERAHIPQGLSLSSLAQFGQHSDLELCDAGDKTPINKLTAITCVDEVCLLHTHESRQIYIKRETHSHPSYYSL